MYKSKHLIAVSSDSKTTKGNKQGVLTGIMYFAPHNISGNQVCPKASPQCIEACLYTAGRGVYTQVQQGRINKTVWFFKERDTFMTRLVENIQSLVTKANKNNMIPAVRLNGTSDIAWEKIAVKITTNKGTKVFRNLMEMFPNVRFYDYSKVLGRKYALSLPNYHLTFSLSENNDSEALEALKQGYNVAVVMNLKKEQDKPETWGGYPVINGDETDIRFRDAKGGHIVALTAKGTAKKQEVGGFVRDWKGGFQKQTIDIALVA